MKQAADRKEGGRVFREGLSKGAGALWVVALGAWLMPGAARGVSYFAWTARGVTWHGNANAESPSWPADGILNESPVVWQLIGSPDAVADPPDLSNSAGGHAGGDDVVWAARHFSSGFSSTEEGRWEAGLYSTGMLRTTQVAGYDHAEEAPWHVYQRIYQAAPDGVAAGTWYYESRPVPITRDARQEMGMACPIGSTAYRPALMPDRQVAASSIAVDITWGEAVFDAEGIRSGKDGGGGDVRGLARQYVVTGVGHGIQVAGGEVNLVLSNAVVDMSGREVPAMAVAAGAVAKLTLAGVNVMVGGDGCPGLRVPAGAGLSIVAGGDLAAVGGDGAAGIGGGRQEEGGGIEILGGSVWARGDRSSGAMDIGAGAGGTRGWPTGGDGTAVHEVVVGLASGFGSRILAIPLANRPYRYEGEGGGDEGRLHAWLPPGTYAICDGAGGGWIAEVAPEGRARILAADPAEWGEADRGELGIHLDDRQGLRITLSSIYTNFPFSLEHARDVAGAEWVWTNGVSFVQSGTNLIPDMSAGRGAFRVQFSPRPAAKTQGGVRP